MSFCPLDKGMVWDIHDFLKKIIETGQKRQLKDMLLELSLLTILIKLIY